MGTLVELARKLRPLIEKAAASLDDADAAEAKELFPTWQTGLLYKQGDRVVFEDILYKCLNEHTAQIGWTPTAAPSLWAEVLIPDPSVIPDWKQPDSTNPYQIGDRVKYNGKIYESTIPNNVWSPADYGWVEVKD